MLGEQMEFSEDPVQLRKQKVDVYARRITMSEFQLTPDMSMEGNEHRVYERLKFDLGPYFDSLAPVSDRCHACGKMKTEPTKELMAYQFDSKMRQELPWEGMTDDRHLHMVAVCGEFLK